MTIESFLYFWLGSIILCALLGAIAIIVEEEDVTLRDLILFIGASLFPLFNGVIMVAFIAIIWNSKHFDKWLSRAVIKFDKSVK